ncbi:MAG: deoxyribose-phosphate aldolase [Clostridia bacterium]
MIDHTILKAAATSEQVRVLCKEAKDNHFAAVCVNPCHVKLAAQELKETDIKVAVVIGFPLGANTSDVKAYEAEKAVDDGAHELDMVINIGALKEGNIQLVESDIRAVVNAGRGAVVKVIIEVCYLTGEEKVMACRLAQSAGAHYVKTSTGFGPSSATKEDIAVMRQTVGEVMKVKAAGGIRNLEDAITMIEAGANRIGTSAGLAIMKELNKQVI